MRFEWPEIKTIGWLVFKLWHHVGLAGTPYLSSRIAGARTNLVEQELDL